MSAANDAREMTAAEEQLARLGRLRDFIKGFEFILVRVAGKQKSFGYSIARAQAPTRQSLVQNGRAVSEELAALADALRTQGAEFDLADRASLFEDHLPPDLRKEPLTLEELSNVLAQATASGALILAEAQSLWHDEV